jgi:hypothetical protein
VVAKEAACGRLLFYLNRMFFLPAKPLGMIFAGDFIHNSFQKINTFQPFFLFTMS